MIQSRTDTWAPIPRKSLATGTNTIPEPDQTPLVEPQAAITKSSFIHRLVVAESVSTSRTEASFLIGDDYPRCGVPQTHTVAGVPSATDAVEPMICFIARRHSAGYRRL